MEIFGLCHYRFQQAIPETKGHAPVKTEQIIVLHTSIFMILDKKQITKSHETKGSKRSRNFIFSYFILRHSLNLLDLFQIFELRHVFNNLLIILLPALSSVLLTVLVNMRNEIL
jgi:hypothetical protein